MYLVASLQHVYLWKDLIAKVIHSLSYVFVALKYTFVLVILKSCPCRVIKALKDESSVSHIKAANNDIKTEESGISSMIGISEDDEEHLEDPLKVSSTQAGTVEDHLHLVKQKKEMMELSSYCDSSHDEENSIHRDFRQNKTPRTILT